MKNTIQQLVRRRRPRGGPCAKRVRNVPRHVLDDARRCLRGSDADVRDALECVIADSRKKKFPGNGWAPCFRWLSPMETRVRERMLRDEIRRRRAT